MPVVLLYHDVTAAGDEDASGFAGPGAARYKLTPDEFRAHLNRLQLTAPEPPALVAQSAARWLLTFDDGGASAATHIADLLESRGWRGWFFITTDRLDTPAFVTRRDVRDLARRGHQIGTHSCSHPPRMSQCAPEQLLHEWRVSRCILEDVLGDEVTSGSVPGGFYSIRVGRAAAQAGLRLLFTSEPTARPGRVDGCTIQGRYTVYRGMSAPQAAALLTSPLARCGQAACWSTKKLAKSLGGAAYIRLRERFWARAYVQRTSAHPAP